MNHKAAARDPHAATLVRYADAWARWVGVLERPLGALIDLLIRLVLAQVFFTSAVLKLASWDNALYLAANEYPVSWLDPVTAAWIGAAVEFLGSLLLAGGLATRLAAAALLALTVVIQLEYRDLDMQMFWAALLGWYVVRGAGALSLDRRLAKGLAGSALPFAAKIVRLLARCTRIGDPGYRMALRTWLGAAITLGALGLAPAGWSALLPLDSAASFHGQFMALAGGVLLLLGLATRITALAFIAVGVGGSMAGETTLQVWWWLALALLVLHGAGAVAGDGALVAMLRRRFPQLAGEPAFSLDEVPHVVIVGAGFGGMACAAKLARAHVAVTLIDRHNYHLFQPLLYQVATASLSPGDIATPVRGLFREHFNVRVLLGEVTGVDTESRQVSLAAQRIDYDYLVLATGAAHSYFGRDDWAPFAPGLKRVEDATQIRRRLLTAFERAEIASDEQERRALLTFLVVGGGPTGVELAGAIAELARHGMEKEFRSFDPAGARVVLVQAGPRLLPTFPDTLSVQTRSALVKLGVEVWTDSRVEAIDEQGVEVNGARIPARTVFWAAGVAASPAAHWLGVEADAAGRVRVEPDLSVAGLPEVFVVGDTAAVNAWHGKPVPGLAPAARQGGEHVARIIRSRIAGHTAAPPFVYRHLGSMATIGRKAAVVDFGWLRLSGAAAWWLWGFVHVAFLVGLRNRVSVAFDWFWAYLTYSSSTRLITGGWVEQPLVETRIATTLSEPRAA
jgi:NADH dehydrogenase/putative oxidoreductase